MFICSGICISYDFHFFWNWRGVFWPGTPCKLQAEDGQPAGIAPADDGRPGDAAHTESSCLVQRGCAELYACVMHFYVCECVLIFSSALYV